MIKKEVQINLMFLEYKISDILCDGYLYLLCLKDLFIAWLCNGYLHLENRYGTKHTKYLLLFVSITHTTVLIAVKEGLLKEKGEKVIEDFERGFKKNGAHKVIVLSVICGIIFYAVCCFVLMYLSKLF